MATISQQLTELVNQKNALADNLVTKGVEASQSETFNTLVPKVLDIQADGNSDNKFTQLVDKSIVTVTAEDLTGATKIGDYAFFNCDSLTTIIIPNSVTSIRNQVFYSCVTLTSMRIEATTPPTLQNTDAISRATTQIQVPMASVDAYKTATNWSNFADIIVGYEEETT